MLRTLASKNQSEALYGTSYAISVTTLNWEEMGGISWPNNTAVFLSCFTPETPCSRLGMDKLRVRISPLLRLEIIEHGVCVAMCFILCYPPAKTTGGLLLCLQSKNRDSLQVSPEYLIQRELTKKKQPHIQFLKFFYCFLLMSLSLYLFFSCVKSIGSVFFPG